jgi:hypothetical protein
MSDQPRINGNTYGWASITLKIGAQVFSGIKAVSYGDSRERGKGYGMGRHHGPRARTSGKYSTDPCVISAEKATASAIRAQLASTSDTGTSFGNTEAQVVVEYTENGVGFTDIVQRCTLTKQTGKREENPDPLYDDLEFDCMWIDWDGKHLFDDSQGTPA